MEYQKGKISSDFIGKRVEVEAVLVRGNKERELQLSRPEELRTAYVCPGKIKESDYRHFTSMEKDERKKVRAFGKLTASAAYRLEPDYFIFFLDRIEEIA